MKVLILGASGIVGQHMRLCIPEGVNPVWVRRTPDPITLGYDLEDRDTVDNLLGAQNPDVIVNLAGESNVDAVENDPERYRCINVGLPRQLADWCGKHARRMVQISSQAVHPGTEPPYGRVKPHPDKCVNDYGAQKSDAELAVLRRGATVIRLTFILGIRPMPYVGRRNPLEAMLAGQSPQVDNRWFSPLMAWDAAKAIWSEVVKPSGEQIIQVGSGRTTRFELAAMVNDDVVPCKHEDFEGIAPRPRDTSFVGEPDVQFRGKMLRTAFYPLNDRVVELSLVFGIPIDKVAEKLAGGFLPLHEAVSEDFREFMRGCKSPHSGDAELLDWYRTTEAYIWELSAYHDDEGFNYAGMCAGIVQCLKSNGCKRVLCLGDGIGDLTLALHRAGLSPTYHDLLYSRTAAYALFRFWRQTGKWWMPSPRLSTENMFPWLMAPSFDAIIALDYFEHLPNLPEWIRDCHAALKPGGLMMAKNAFGKGSGADGAMPMHLTVNDQYADEAAWVDLCVESGFTLYDPATPDWWRKV